MSSQRKRKAEDDNEKEQNTHKYAGGALQRTGKSADSWNEAVGASLPVMSHLYYPTVRTILQRYRFLRMNNETASIKDLAKGIGDEVVHIWEKARIPTCSSHNVCVHVTQIIDWWNKSGKNSIALRTSPAFQNKLNGLLDIAEKPKGRPSLEKCHNYLIEQMKVKGKKRAKGFEFAKEGEHDQDWKNDMIVYLDQKGERLMQIGTADHKLNAKEMKMLEQSSSLLSSSAAAATGSSLSLKTDETILIPGEENDGNEPTHDIIEAEDNDVDFVLSRRAVTTQSSNEEHDTPRCYGSIITIGISIENEHPTADSIHGRCFQSWWHRHKRYQIIGKLYPSGSP